MSMAHQLTQDEVLAGRDALPAFPRVISEILASLDDPDANLNLLVGFIGRDPVLAARVFSLANAAANKTRHNATVRDLYTATSLIGLSRLREMAVMSSLSTFLRGATPAKLSPEFWRHSAAAGVSAQQVAVHARLSGEMALIGGLLHDIGQLWLFQFQAETFLQVWQASASHTQKIYNAEQEAFGVDHATIGAWLAEGWGLPPAIGDAIRHHHTPDSGPDEPLLHVVHVAEVLSNALDMTGSNSARVTDLSARSCQKLGLNWDESANALFGRIDAMGQFAATYFQPTTA
jgi:putative nucleotidyltransferase with HDIG domain